MALTGRAKSRARRASSKKRSSASSSSSGSSSRSSSGSSSGSSNRSIQDRVNSIAAQANAINNTYQNVKGSLSQSDRASLARGIGQATEGIRSIRSSSGGRSQANTITPDSFERIEAVQLPSPVVPVRPSLDADAINAGLAPQGITDGLINIAPLGTREGAGDSERAATDAANIIGQFLNESVELARPDDRAQERAIFDAREQAGVDAAQREFNRFSNQLNAITAKRDADILSLEGQGRGITDTIIGGQQARITRDAAISALPIQAQLAAAQGNLEQANALMGQLYQAKSADIQANLAFRQNLANSVMDFANSSQQSILRARMADSQELADIAQNNLNFQRELQTQALEFGQNGLIAEISNIDPSSPTFEQEISSVVSRLRRPTSAAKRSTQVVGNRLIDTQTGEVIADFVEGGSQVGISPVTGKVFTQAQSEAGTFANRMEQAAEILSEMELDAPSSFIGGVIPETLKGDKRKSFEQAENNFITALLRRESGANIAADEFSSARAVYIPQPGDDTETLEQKALARRVAFLGLVNASVGSYEQLRQELNASNTSTEPAVYESSSGNVYNLPN